MTEGVPQACSDYPMGYEFARERAAERLGVHPKQLSLTGSARLGYSLAESKFGQPFNFSASDIDLFVVSEELFSLISDEFADFLEDWKRGKIKPRHALQEKYWQASRERDPNNIKRGFLDASHIPTLDRFPIAQMIGDAAYKFHVNFESVTGVKLGTKASIRVYQNWESAVRQITFTLKGNLQRRGTQP